MNTTELQTIWAKLEHFGLGDHAAAALSLDAIPVDPMITGATAPTPDSPKFALLGSIEFKIERAPYQAAWSSLLGRMTKEWPLYAACRNGEASCAPGLQRWQKLIQSVRGLPRSQQLARLNPAINNMASYADDLVIYGARDYWASPSEFFRGRADCEDYAVVKFFTLLQLGFGPQELRIVIVKDTKRGVLHAVLTVELGGKIYVLDSLRSQPVEQQFTLKYEPVSSINTEGRWAHVVTPQIRSRFLAELGKTPAPDDRAEVKPKPAKAQKPVVDSTLYSPHTVLVAAG
jgi:predicted transglutaminase-like cysteine proteinase